MIAYPTPTFDAKTIQSGPGYRPTGKSGMTMKTNQPEAETAMTVPNKKTKNGAYFNHGVRLDDIPKKYDYSKGTPLSKPDGDGNQVDTMLIVPPRYAEPKNEMMQDILDILNAKVIPDERKGRLTAGQIRALDARTKKRGKPGKMPPESPLQDFAETQRQMNKEKLIRNAMAEGFSRKEAEKGYEKLKEEEVVNALKKERQPSEQLRDVLDSKFGTGEEGRASVGNPNVPIMRQDQTIIEIETSGFKKMKQGILPEGLERFFAEEQKLVSKKTPELPLLRPELPLLRPVEPSLFMGLRQMELPREVAEQTLKPLREMGKGGYRRFESGKETTLVTVGKMAGRPKGSKDTLPRVRSSKKE